MTFDVRGHGVGTDERGETMLIVARESSGTEHLDELLDNLAEGRDFGEALVLAALLLKRALWGNEVAVLYRDENGVKSVAHTGISDGAVAALKSEKSGTPWRRAVEHVEPMMEFPVDQLEHASLRHALKRDGFDVVFALPLPDPLFREPVALVVLGPYGMLPALGLIVAIDRVRRLLSVALRNRYQRASLEQAARTDPLTGIANRRRFEHALDDALARLERDPDLPVALAVVDVDDFKLVNDTHGHACGDRVLCEIASRLQRSAGATGIAARLGGDEFAILLVGSDTDAALAALEAGFRAPISVAGDDVQVGVSLGAARARAGDSRDSLMDRADARAYVAKRERKRSALTPAP
jgi:diguanylate cyclase (GGDEF)-like protein